MALRHWTTGSVAALACCLAFVAPSGAASPRAQTSGEELVSYLTKGKLKLAKRIQYSFVCSVNCQVTATASVKVKGPDPSPQSNTGQFSAGLEVAQFLTPNKPLRNAIKDHIGAAKLVTEITARDLATGETDTDRRTFRFKK